MFWTTNYDIYNLLLIINNKVNQIMTAIDDLNATITSLQTNFQMLDTAIQSEIQALKDALANNNTAAVEAAANSISAVSSKMVEDAQALTSSVPVQP